MPQGLHESLSRWRVLTAYLRPPPSQDAEYIAQRDHEINEITRAFSRVFAPWRSPKYKDEDQIRSLSAILKSAAELGVWLFSQPSDYQFRWPEQSKIGPTRIAVAPALVKTTDERGRVLSQPQVMLEAVIKRIG